MRLEQQMKELVEAMREQTEAITALAESNNALIDLLVSGMNPVDDPVDGPQYLDGSRG